MNDVLTLLGHEPLDGYEPLRDLRAVVPGEVDRARIERASGLTLRT